MAELRDVIRRLKLGHGVRDIHRSTGVHRTIVRQLQELALFTAGGTQLHGNGGGPD